MIGSAISSHQTLHTCNIIVLHFFLPDLFIYQTNIYVYFNFQIKITGEQKAVALCYEVGSDVAVGQSLCANLTLPDLNSRECDMGECPPVYSWLVKYGECSVTCGKGSHSPHGHKT